MKKYEIKYLKMSDGRLMIREVDIETGKRRMVNLPQVSDYDVDIKSYKYNGKTLGEICDLDKKYIIWLVQESSVKDTIKKAAARLFYNCPYWVRKDGEIIDETDLYNPVDAQELVNRLKNEKLSDDK